MLSRNLRSFCLCLALLLPTSAHADLILDVSGMPGSGETTWMFSGSSVATGGWFFGSSGVQAFLPATDVVTSTVNLIPSSGSVTVSFDGDTRNLVHTGFQENGATDGFILGTDGASVFSAGGETIVWSGTITMAADILDLNPGVYLDRALNLGTLDITITSVPEPSTALLIAFGLAGLSLRRRP